jgi:dihydropteroate synthase
VSDRTARKNLPFPALNLPSPAIMGILNVTPDSFSDGGDIASTDAAISRGTTLTAAGAHILDIGGESTRPGATPISPSEEIFRVVPVVTALAGAGHIVSIDTRRAPVMHAALNAGATIVNDVSALTNDPAALATVAEHKAHVILMHMQGQPGSMQDAPRYDDVVGEILDYLASRITACEAAGIKRSTIAADPGIGFGKSTDHNLELIARLDEFSALDVPIVIGASRKSFISNVAAPTEPKQRLAGSIASALASLERGAAILRVHDVAETAQALAIWHAIMDR